MLSGRRKDGCVNRRVYFLVTEKMMRKLLVALALCLMAGSSSAGAYNPYAPNPFDAVEKNTWEYAYITELTKAGLTGAGPEKTDPAYGLTRYEMVQMVANAVRNRNRGTAEERKKIDRLAKEFADDLTYAGLNPEEEGNAGVAFDWRDDTKKKY